MKQITNEQIEEAIELLRRVVRGTNIIHLDMGGKHKYTINYHGHQAISEIYDFIKKLDK